MAADVAWDFAVNPARREPRERACLAGLIVLVARDLQLRQLFRRIGRAQQHDVGIVAVRRLAAVNKRERAGSCDAAALQKGKDRLPPLARVAPDMPAGDNHILLDEGAASDKGLAQGNRLKIRVTNGRRAESVV